MPEKNSVPDENPTELEKRIDKMMDPRAPEIADPPKPRGAPDMPEIDIFENQEGNGKDAVKLPPEMATSDDPVSSTATQDSGMAGEEITEDTSVDNPEADPLVDDIVARESDDLLVEQDAEIAKAFDGYPPTYRQRIRTFFAAWWASKPARYGTIAVLLTGFTIAGIIPDSRYFILNTAGVRAAASLTILDNSTDLPLRNVEVTVGNYTARTNRDGVARLEKLKLGTQEMSIRQQGFARVSRQVTLGLGSNPLGELGLKAVGTQFKFKLTDYVSGRPVKNAEASSGDANARADGRGEIILTIGKVETPKITVALVHPGYRTEKVTIDTTSSQVTNVTMVTNRKEVFISKASGKFDVYKIDMDGKNKQVLLTGTGTERPQMTLVQNMRGDKVALVSSRDVKRNAEGYLLDTLTLIDIDDGSTLTLEHSERIQLVDWLQEKLIYVKVKAGTSAGNSERNQLMSYDYDTVTRQQLAAANYFAGIFSAKGVVYYAAASYSAPGQSVFAKVNPDGSGKQTVLNTRIWDIVRTDYENLYLAGQNNWYSYVFGNKEAEKLTQQPVGANSSRFYLEIPGSKKALWTENRDGKDVLLVYDTQTKKDKAVATASGRIYPERWLDGRTVVYRVVAPSETAAYVLSLETGTPKKITDVTNVTGLGPWYY